MGTNYYLKRIPTKEEIEHLAASAFRRVGASLGFLYVVASWGVYALFKLLYIIIYNNYI